MGSEEGFHSQDRSHGWLGNYSSWGGSGSGRDKGLWVVMVTLGVPQWVVSRKGGGRIVSINGYIRLHECVLYTDMCVFCV